MSQKLTREFEHRLLDLHQLVATYGGTVWFWRTQFWSKRLPAVHAHKRKLLFDRVDVERLIERYKRSA